MTTWWRHKMMMVMIWIYQQHWAPNLFHNGPFKHNIVIRDFNWSLCNINHLILKSIGIQNHSHLTHLKAKSHSFHSSHGSLKHIHSFVDHLLNHASFLRKKHYCVYLIIPPSKECAREPTQNLYLKTNGDPFISR